MTRNVWVWVVLALVALGLGFFGGRISTGGQASPAVDAKIKELSDKLAALSSKVDELTQRVAQSDIAEIEELKATIERLSKSTGFGALKVAFVRSPEEVMVKYKGTEERVKQFKEEGAKRQVQIDALQKRFDKGEISRKEFEERVNQLQMELAQLDQQLTNEIADKILVAVNELGREKAYDMILKRKDVVLFYKEGLLEDITDQVIKRMNE